MQKILYTVELDEKDTYVTYQITYKFMYLILETSTHELVATVTSATLVAHSWRGLVDMWF